MILKLSRAVARRYDSCPASPAWWAERVLEAYDARRRRRAEAHPAWSAIEARRAAHRAPNVLFLSEDLDWQDWEAQQRIYYGTTPVGILESLVELVARVHLDDLVSRAGWAAQRAARGWDDLALWNIGDSLCQTLGAQLVELSGRNMSYPGTGEYASNEAWTAALRANGQALLDYAHHGDTDDPVDQDAVLAAAQAALIWVAEHLPTLWD